MYTMVIPDSMVKTFLGIMQDEIMQDQILPDRLKYTDP